ncbi:hypothetical protein ACP4OV_024728 [Aristida adscensionis]
MGATDGVSGDNRCARFLRRHPHLEVPLLAAIFGGFLLALCWMIHGPPEFTATVTSAGGLDPADRAEAAPAFGVTLRATNHKLWQFCFEPGTVAVAYAGVPLARGDVPGYCVPGRSVATVRAVAGGAAGEGLGIPRALHERMEAQRRRRERVAVTVRVRLHEDRRGVVPHGVGGWPPMLLWCDAMLDGRPTAGGPPSCAAFGMGLWHGAPLIHGIRGDLN